jgi:hypothetical protein
VLGQKNTSSQAQCSSNAGPVRSSTATAAAAAVAVKSAEALLSKQRVRAYRQQAVQLQGRRAGGKQQCRGKAACHRDGLLVKSTMLKACLEGYGHALFDARACFNGGGDVNSDNSV